MNIKKINKLSKLIRYYILISTTKAGSGHPTSSLSTVELMAVLYFSGILKYDIENPQNPNNDRVIFSKGHASPLLYSIFAVAGAISEKQLLTLRKFGSPLEGHPTFRFKWAEAATGSLGQGLSIGFGMALNGKYLDKLPYKVYVLLGDSEMAEGSNWEAIELANYYKLNNLIGIIDVNNLGQCGETMLDYKMAEYEKRISSFGWNTILVKDGHNIQEVYEAYKKAINLQKKQEKPVMIIAKTIKGKGVSFVEGKDGWHGKALSQEDFEKAVKELEKIDFNIKGKIQVPKTTEPKEIKIKVNNKRIEEFLIKPKEKEGQLYLATRKAYGNALLKIGSKNSKVVVLDAEVSNSTYSELFKKVFPERFFEMFIAEQNMVGAGVGLAKLGKIPFISSFAAFLTRAFDQIRMAQYSKVNLKFCGSHAGVSIGQDGPSQMGLEDIAMFRTIENSVVFYPCDATSTEKLVELMLRHKGISYIRTTRSDTSIIYSEKEKFEIGGFKVLRSSNKDDIVIITAGITVFEALKAQEELKQIGVNCKVIDLYCIKPINKKELEKAVGNLPIITVEDHRKEGGLGEAVKSEISEKDNKIYSLYVEKTPMSGMPEELLRYEKIDKNAIIEKVRQILNK